MAYKMKGSGFYGKGNSSPAKQTVSQMNKETSSQKSFNQLVAKEEPGFDIIKGAPKEKPKTKTKPLSKKRQKVVMRRTELVNKHGYDKARKGWEKNNPGIPW
jgi:hypothetical protein